MLDIKARHTIYEVSDTERKAVEQFTVRTVKAFDRKFSIMVADISLVRFAKPRQI